MGLTVVSVAFGFAPVRPDAPGGAEQVLSQIDDALVEAGARSVVIAQEGSRVAGELIPIPACEGDGDLGRTDEVHKAIRARIAEVVGRGEADVIHLHGLDFADVLPPPGPPAVVTVHLPLDWYPPGALTANRPRTVLTPVSRDQAARAPEGLALGEPIPNGVDTELFAPEGEREDYALVLGRVCPEKGFHHALDAARLADVPLIAAGRVFPYAAHQEHFEREVRPRLDAKRRFVGEVQGARKRRLLARARCVLIPSTAPETSSLVAMEALASGTPVIAFRSGALPEIVESGKTGFLVDSVEAMARAIKRVGEIDPADCRRAALDRFPLTRTTSAYLDLYRKLAA